VGVDTDPLERFAEVVKQYYEGLAQRYGEAEGQETPEDRMYV
jgi:predicted ATP-grasp superfamily ATP-dependent carboligase